MMSLHCALTALGPVVVQVVVGLAGLRVAVAWIRGAMRG